jgi:HNH endonuclease
LKRSELKRKTPLERKVSIRKWMDLTLQGEIYEAYRAKYGDPQPELRQTPLKRSPAKRRKSVPSGTRKRVMARSGGLCVACTTAPAIELHHVLPVQKWPDLTTKPANLVAVCRPCHANHETAFARIPRHRLPDAAIGLAHSVGAGWYIERTYP